MKRGMRAFFALTIILAGIWGGLVIHYFSGISYPYALLLGGSLAILGFVFCHRMVVTGQKGWQYLNNLMEKTSFDVLVASILGLLVGVAIGFVLGFPFFLIAGGGEYIALIPFFTCGFLGLNLGRKRVHDFMKLFPRLGNDSGDSEGESGEKILDTSAIIDGRIYDVALSGFLEGRLAVPSFVMEELRHIADSPDYIRRSKGRRGLEILSKMQKHPNIKLRILEGDYPDEREVDMKLLRLCKELRGSIVTNDYNLNKVAELQGIKVLNVNELTNAVKVMVFPGETMKVTVIKEGKEEGQGVGYLEDGTMVVVESGEEDIGQEVEVVVTSVFQTAAGRMIFTRKTREGSRVNQAVQKLHEVNLFG